MSHRPIVWMCLVGAITIPIGAAQAVEVVVSHPYELYGHVWNTDTGTNDPGSVSVPWCAPTATANSFWYLYGEALGPDPITIRNQLATGWNGPNGPRPGMDPDVNGTPDREWWENKVWYLDDYAPGTILKGMANVDTSTWHKGNLILPGFPTWEWLWGEIASCEDVEIKIDTGTSLAHALTLTSMKFDDLNNSGVWELGEPRSIDYIDPNNPTQTLWGQVSQALVGGQLQFYWDNLGKNEPAWVTIELAYSESIPLPAALVPGLLTLLGLAGVRTVKLIRRRAA